MTANRSLFAAYRTLKKPVEIQIASGKVIEAVGVGKVPCLGYNGQDWFETVLTNVHHVPRTRTLQPVFVYCSS